MELADLTIHAKNMSSKSSYSTILRYTRVLAALWGLSWPESGMAVRVTLVFGLGCLQRGRGARKTQKRA